MVLLRCFAGVSLLWFFSHLWFLWLKLLEHLVFILGLVDVSQAETLGEEQHSYGFNNLATVSIEEVADLRAKGTEQKVVPGSNKKS